MKTLVFFDFLTRFYLILSAIPVKFGQSFRYPGKTSCSYYGGVDKCGVNRVPVAKLPAQCSSFFYDGVSINEFYQISGSFTEDDEIYLSIIVEQDKPSFLYYGHIDLNGWGNVFNQKGNINKEVAAIRDYMEYFPVAGLVLKDLNIDSNWKLPEYLSTSLKVYVGVLKKIFPDLLVGLSIRATVFQKFGICSSATKNTCFDFKILNTVFDFFSISFEDFNKCDPSHIRGGIVPLDGMPGNTLAKFKDSLRNSGIDKNKILFKFSLSPKLGHYSGTPRICDATMALLCHGRNNQPYNVWCADNSVTFHDKGIYAKENGAGFIAEYIDMNDPDSKCKCKWPFPSFYYLLNGFTGTGVWTTCPLFDRK